MAEWGLRERLQRAGQLPPPAHGLHEGQTGEVSLTRARDGIVGARVRLLGSSVWQPSRSSHAFCIGACSERMSGFSVYEKRK